MAFGCCRKLSLAVSGAAILFTLGCGGASKTESVVTTPVAPRVATNVLTAHNDVQRTGQNLTESSLTTSNVNSTSFGKLFSVPTDGRVDAQPLYVSQLKMSGKTESVVFAATEHDSVYAFDASSGAIYWQVSLLAAGETPSDDFGCHDVIPEVGIMATPVIDLQGGSNGVIYFLAMSKDAAGAYHHRLHALDLTTGTEQLGGPVEIAATVPGTGDGSSNGQMIFDPAQYLGRPGLLLLNGVVYTGWGSHCDTPPYTGWLMAYDKTTLKQTSVFNFSPNGYGAAIWNSGGGLAADPTSGRIFVGAGNGIFDTDLDANGFPAKSDFGNAFVRLNTAGGKLVAEDYWTMDNTTAESTADADLGSGGVMVLPNLTNAAGQTVQLAVGGGKDGTLWIFNRQNMGKFNSLSNSEIYQAITVGLPSFATPAYFNGRLYSGAVQDSLRSFAVNNGTFSSTADSVTATTFAYPGTTPSISANGTDNGIVWAIEKGAPEILHAYRADNVGIELYNSNESLSGRDQLGDGPKYVVPTIADGRVVVGSMTAVSVFGLLK